MAKRIKTDQGKALLNNYIKCLCMTFCFSVWRYTLEGIRQKSNVNTGIWDKRIVFLTAYWVQCLSLSVLQKIASSYDASHGVTHPAFVTAHCGQIHLPFDAGCRCVDVACSIKADVIRCHFNIDCSFFLFCFDEYAIKQAERIKLWLCYNWCRQ